MQAMTWIDRSISWPCMHLGVDKLPNQITIYIIAVIECQEHCFSKQNTPAISRREGFKGAQTLRQHSPTPCHYRDDHHDHNDKVITATS
jgi:hypothetical protein